MLPFYSFYGLPEFSKTCTDMESGVQACGQKAKIPTLGLPSEAVTSVFLTNGVTYISSMRTSNISRKTVLPASRKRKQKLHVLAKASATNQIVEIRLFGFGFPVSQPVCTNGMHCCWAMCHVAIVTKLTKQITVEYSMKTWLMHFQNDFHYIETKDLQNRRIGIQKYHWNITFATWCCWQSVGLFTVSLESVGYFCLRSSNRPITETNLC